MMHFVYVTTCLITDKYYIGVHSTSNIDDGYLGSGTILKRSVLKYGPENHLRTVLKKFDTAEEAYTNESLVVNSERLLDPLCMNIKLGGRGSWDDVSSETQRTRWEKADLRLKELRSSDPIWVQNFQNASSKAQKASYARGSRSPTGAVVGELRAEMVRRSLTPEARAKRKASYQRTGHSKGSKNSQYNTCWVTNSEITKKIPLSELDKYFSMGYHRGRKKHSKE